MENKKTIFMLTPIALEAIASPRVAVAEKTNIGGLNAQILQGLNLIAAAELNADFIKRVKYAYAHIPRGSKVIRPKEGYKTVKVILDMEMEYYRENVLAKLQAVFDRQRRIQTKVIVLIALSYSYYYLQDNNEAHETTDSIKEQLDAIEAKLDLLLGQVRQLISLKEDIT